MTETALFTLQGGLFAKIPIWIEHHAGKLAFFGSFTGLDVFGHYVQFFTDARCWRLDQLYGAVFNFAAIEIGGLLALYALLVSDTPTTRRFGATKSFQTYLGFVRSGIWASGMTALASLPILVISPIFSSPWMMGTILASLWYGLSIAMFVCMFRVIFIARMLVEPNWSGGKPH